jgi:hypothetical protein
MNKKITLFIVLIFAFNILTVLSKEHEAVLKAPDNWKSEIIPFPLGFAREIDFVGYEDIRFAPRWSDRSSPEFWAYTFVWYVDKGPAMTESKLTEIYNQYYDGLMGVNNSIKSSNKNAVKLNKTISKFIKVADGFKGTIVVYDRFFSKDYISLNVNVKETFCPKMNKQIILNDISTKDFEHEVWKLFDDVNVSVKCN